MKKSEIKMITEYIFLRSKPQKADLVIIFGTRHQNPLQTFRRFYNKGLIKKVLLSGGINRITEENEAKKMVCDLVAMGVRREDIFIEDKSHNSLENVVFSKELIKEKIGFQNVHTILTITKHYHSRRALMTLKKHFPQTVKIFPVTYKIYGFTKDNWFNSKMGKEKVISEWEKIQRYLKKGDIEEL